MVRGFRETWVFVTRLRNVICTRKMCSVVWHLDGHSIFLFFCTQKICFQCFCRREHGAAGAGAEVDAGGGLTIVIQLTSPAGTLPLPRFLPRNRLNKERLRDEGRERGRIFLLSTWDRHTNCPANLNQWSSHFPSS